MLKLLRDGSGTTISGGAKAMAYGMTVREETPRERGDRLATSASFWLDEARDQMTAGDAEAAMEMTLRAEEALRLLRYHNGGGRR